LLNQHSCSACHADNAKLVGPSWRDIRGKHGGRDDAQAYLATKIKAGGVGVWGQIPMPPQALPDNEAQLIARWLAEGARK
jgi:cytochrome c